MRSLAAFILVIISVLAMTPAPQAQEKSPREKRKMKMTECGTVVPPGQFEVELARKANDLLLATQQQDPPTDAPYYLPLTIHIVRRSDGTGGLTLDQMDRAMRDLNTTWQPVGVQFFIYGNIDYINSDTHFNVPNVDVNQDALRQVHVVANTINVYFTDLVDLCGQSSFPDTAIQGLLMDIDCAGTIDNPATPANESNPSSFPHEMGHYFDLLHTHQTWTDNMGNVTGVECPSGNNWSTAGDFLRDTPADPNLEGNIVGDCAYNNSATTPSVCDSTAYNPPTRNLMSYSDKLCRDQITGDQIRKVLQSLRDKDNRKNLIITGARYVDPLASSSNADCSYDFPCRTVTKAIQVALNGDFIFIKPGIHQASQFGGKRVTLSRWGTAGVAQIKR